MCKSAIQWYFCYYEVTLKISTNDCFRMSVTIVFSVLQISAMQTGPSPSPTFRFMKWRQLDVFRTMTVGH